MAVRLSSFPATADPVAGGPSKGAMSRARRLVRAVVHVSAALVLGLSVYLGLIQLGLVRSPLAPKVSGDLALARTEREGLRVLVRREQFHLRELDVRARERAGGG